MPFSLIRKIYIFDNYLISLSLIYPTLKLQYPCASFMVAMETIQRTLKRQELFSFVVCFHWFQLKFNVQEL